MRMSTRPEPHRISLARGWKYSKDWQRFFHKPTNLCQQSVVRLRIDRDKPGTGVNSGTGDNSGTGIEPRERFRC